MELNHLSHAHPLILSEEKYNEFFNCSGCGEPVVGPCYCCTQCPYVLHKWCAELPPEILRPRLHYAHPLKLIFQKDEDEDILEVKSKDVEGKDEDEDEEDDYKDNYYETMGYCCRECGKKIRGFAYRCRECLCYLDILCASLPKVRKLRFYGYTEEVVTRDLYFSMDNHPNIYKCDLCEDLGTGPRLSGYFLFFHIHCGMLPKCVENPRHEHPLNLHIPMHKHPLNFPISMHEHPLNLHIPLIEDEDEDEDSIVETNLLCCKVCKQLIEEYHSNYYCANCNFAAHVSCANQMDEPVRGIVENNQVYQAEKEKGMQKRLIHFDHQHPLALSVEDGIHNRCNGCFSDISGYGYSCHGCKYYLHKRCAELPMEIQHKLHPDHRLTLTRKGGTHFSILCGRSSRDDLTRLGIATCNFCEDPFPDMLFFSCEECSFKLHITCALVPENLHHPRHEHPLTPTVYWDRPVLLRPDGPLPDDDLYMESLRPRLPMKLKLLDQPMTPICQACQFKCNGVFLHCSNDCNFSLHVLCARLPVTGKATTHLHTLTLTDSYEEDSNALEFICDACEEKRTPGPWLYWCENPTCHFVAHLDCGYPKLEL